MKTEESQSRTPHSDELDLSNILEIFNRFFGAIFRLILRFFAYLKRNGIILAILVLAGLAVGYGLNQLVESKQKIEIILKSNQESRNYLYEVVHEIRANVMAKDMAFLDSLNIEVEDLKKFDIEIAELRESEGYDMQEQIDYLELLDKFRDDPRLVEMVRNEVLKQSNLNHRLTFTFMETTDGEKIARTLLDYINSNSYYRKLAQITVENATQRIEQNDKLLLQIDELLARYTEKIDKTNDRVEANIVLDNEERIDVTGLLGMKKEIIEDTEQQRMEILAQKEAIKVINFGNRQIVHESFFGKRIVLMPLIFVFFFWLIDILKYLNRKAKEQGY